MNYLKKFILILMFLFPINNSYGVIVGEVDNQAFSVFESILPTDGSGSIGGIDFNDDGTSVFVLFFSHKILGDNSGNLYVEEFTLSTPFDISTKSATYVARCNINSHGEAIYPYDLEFSSDGRSLFFVFIAIAMCMAVGNTSFVD